MRDRVREPFWAWCLVGVLVYPAISPLGRGGSAARPHGPEPTASPDRGAPPGGGGGGSWGPWAPRADPSRMAVRDLRRLPGLGDKRAAAAADARFRHDRGTGPLGWEEVRGIGPITASRVAERLAAEGVPEPSRLVRSARNP